MADVRWIESSYYRYRYDKESQNKYESKPTFQLRMGADIEIVHYHWTLKLHVDTPNDPHLSVSRTPTLKSIQSTLNKEVTTL